MKLALIKFSEVGDYEVELLATGGIRHYVSIRHLDNGAQLTKRGFNSLIKASGFYDFAAHHLALYGRLD